MKIIADENMPFAAEAFSTIGEVTLLPGRKMSSHDLVDADILAIRSVTKVNSDLLRGTSVKFVGTATIGTDHVDIPYLESCEVGFSAAPGCNAVSVGEYLVAALIEVADSLGIKLHGKSLGIVGCGNVGSRVAARAALLGLEVVINDPPLLKETGDTIRYRPLDEILDCDIVTFHVPLTKDGDCPTWHLCDYEFMGKLKNGAILINTSRGAVADNQAIKKHLDSGHLAAAILDVWEGEPKPDCSLLSKVFIASPHIAGYSFDGKARGTTMIYNAACAHFGIEPVWTPKGLLPVPDNASIVPEKTLSDSEEILRNIVRQAYLIRSDDRDMRKIIELDENEQAAYFDSLRKNYPVRREFEAFRVDTSALDPKLAETIHSLGFGKA